MQRLHQQTRHGAKDQRVFHHRQQHLARSGFTAPKVLQHHHRHHVIDGHHDGHHQGGDAEVALRQQLCGDGQAQQHKVAAEGRLDHDAPAFRHLFRQQRHRKRDGHHAQRGAHHKQSIGQTHRLGKIGGIDIIEQHHRHESVKGHLIKPPHLLRADPAQVFNGIAHGDDEKQRHNGVEGDRQCLQQDTFFRQFLYCHAIISRQKANFNRHNEIKRGPCPLFISL